MPKFVGHPAFFFGMTVLLAAAILLNIPAATAAIPWKEIKAPDSSPVMTVMDQGTAGAFEAGEKSHIKFKEDFSEFHLEEGKLLLLFEPGSAEEKSRSVVVHGIRLVMGAGGVAVRAFKNGALFKCFGGTARVFAGEKTFEIKEGFKFLCDAEGRETSSKRMTYADYRDWLKWTRKFYEEKDKGI